MARQTLGAFTPSQITRLEHLLKWYEQTGRYVVPPPNRIAERREAPPFFIGKANATIAAGGNGAATIWTSTTLGGSNEAAVTTQGSSETVYSFGGHSAVSGDELYLFRHWRSGQLYFLNASKDPASAVVPTYGGLYTTFDTIGTGSGTEEVVFDTAMPAAGMTISTSNNSITIDTAGDYYVEFSLNATLAGTTSSADGWKIQLFKDGSLAGFETIRPLDLDSAQSRMGHWSAIMTLEATDVLTIECDKDSSNTVALDNVMFVVKRVG